MSDFKRGLIGVLVCFMFGAMVATAACMIILPKETIVTYIDWAEQAEKTCADYEGVEGYDIEIYIKTSRIRSTGLSSVHCNSGAIISGLNSTY